MPWALHFYRKPADEPDQQLSQLLTARTTEVLRAVRSTRYDRQPFVMDGRGQPEMVINAYFGSRSFRGFAPSTRKKYALSVRLWLNFCEAREVAWSAASPDTVADFKYWRMTDPANPARVSGSAMHGDIAALSALYRWAGPRHGITDPVLRHELHPRRSEGRDTHRSHAPLAAAAAEPAGVRDRNVKWLDPAAVRRWIAMGLRGLDRDDREDPRSGNRTGTRDAALAHLLYGSGLRVSEGASLLLAELPNDHDPQRLYRSGRLAASCGKGRRGRQWWIPRTALSEAWSYAEGQRAEAICRARREGRYDRLRGISVIESWHGDRRVAVRSPGGGSRVVPFDALTPDERRMLFIETAGGLEPAALWLNENGLPRPAHAWQATFRTGNERLARAGLPRFQCTPHMLRHSFALRWYSVGRLLWDRRLAHLTEEEQRDFRAQFGDTWQFVQTLLGHRHPQTTVDIYLEPFKSLEVELLLECAAEVPLTALMQVIFDRDHRVLHDPAAAG